MDIITWSQLKKKADLVSGKVPASELPSYVDDVIEVENYASLPATGETGKIYVTLDDNSTYRWSGSTYVAVGSTYTAGTGIKIEGKVISVDSSSGIAIYDTRIADANSWLTNGYVKTRNVSEEYETATANLPPVCTGLDRWGVLLYVAENNGNKAGLQQYFPIDGTYKGRVFYRSVTGTSSSPPNPIFGTWNIVPWSSEKQDTLTTQTAYTSQGTSTKVPQITTNTLGQVTGITEVSITYPTVDQTYSSSSTNAQSGVSVASALTSKQDTITSSSKLSADLVSNGTSNILVPALPSDASSKTYTLQAVNGTLTWVETTWSV